MTHQEQQNKLRSVQQALELNAGRCVSIETLLDNAQAIYAFVTKEDKQVTMTIGSTAELPDILQLNATDNKANENE